MYLYSLQRIPGEDRVTRQTPGLIISRGQNNHLPSSLPACSSFPSARLHPCSYRHMSCWAPSRQDRTQSARASSQEAGPEDRGMAHGASQGPGRHRDMSDSAGDGQAVRLRPPFQGRIEAVLPGNGLIHHAEHARPPSHPPPCQPSPPPLGSAAGRRSVPRAADLEEDLGQGKPCGTNPSERDDSARISTQALLVP